MPRSLTTGKSVEILGIKELAAKINAMKSAVASQEAQDVVARAAQTAAWEFRTEMSGAGWPHETPGAAFAYGKPGGRRDGTISALAGVRKRGPKPYPPSYVEWWDRKAGKVVGESLVTMFEKGTAHMRPRPVLESAFRAVKPILLRTVSEGFANVIARHAK